MAPIVDWFKVLSNETDTYVLNMPEGILDVAGYALKGLPLSPLGGAFDASAPFDASRSIWHTLGTAVGDGIIDDPNPYAIAYSYAGLEGEEELLTEFKEYAEKLSDLATILSTDISVDEITDIDDIIVDDTEQFNLLELDYDISAGLKYDEQIERYLAGMFAMNAHTASPFYLKLGDMLVAKARDLAAFRARLRVDTSGRQAQITLETKKANLSARLDLIRLTVDAERINRAFAFNLTEAWRGLYFTHFEANRQRYDADVELNTKAVTWGFDNSMRLAQLTVPSAGMPLEPPRPTKLQQGLASALSVGSNIGMQVGAVAGPGAGIAAGLAGAALGFGSQLLGQ